jgi:hypothetical protein
MERPGARLEGLWGASKSNPLEEFQRKMLAEVEQLAAEIAAVRKRQRDTPKTAALEKMGRDFVEVYEAVEALKKGHADLREFSQTLARGHQIHADDIKALEEDVTQTEFKLEHALNRVRALEETAAPRGLPRAASGYLRGEEEEASRPHTAR